MNQCLKDKIGTPLCCCWIGEGVSNGSELSPSPPSERVTEKEEEEEVGGKWAEWWLTSFLFIILAIRWIEMSQ